MLAQLSAVYATPSEKNHKGIMNVFKKRYFSRFSPLINIDFEQMKEKNGKVSKETLVNFSMEKIVTCDLNQLAYSVTIPVTHCIGTNTKETTLTSHSR